MKELISKNVIAEIVIEAGARNGAMDYQNWTEGQFKSFMCDALYMAINSIDKKALAAILNKTE
jgi:hypothetical protein